MEHEDCKFATVMATIRLPLPNAPDPPRQDSIATSKSVCPQSRSSTDTFIAASGEIRPPSTGVDRSRCLVDLCLLSAASGNDNNNSDISNMESNGRSKADDEKELARWRGYPSICT